jgi:hypothetical protein
MTLYEFDLLNEQKKMIALRDSVHIGVLYTSDGIKWCYQIDDFYVEQSLLEGRRMFLTSRNPDVLEPYMSQIKVDLS